MNEENHRGWKLVSGVRRDLVNLFKLFGDADSVRFEDFCKVWKEMNFSLIYSHRVSFVELLEFSEELLQIVKEYMFSVYEFHTTVAALYALYGLYFKQPIRGGAKIRITKTEWEEIYNLVENSKKAGHYDVAFIFLKLYLSGAFSFVATIRPAGLERGFRKYSEKRTSLCNKVADAELLYRPLVSQKLVDSLVKLESLYGKKKSELLGGKNLVFIDGKFAESLKEELKNYELTQSSSKAKAQQVQAECDTPEEGTKCNEGGAQTKVSTRASKSKKSNDSDEEVQIKKIKFSKKQLELVAKKKAEFYIKKLQSKNNLTESSQKKPSLLSLEELDISD